MNETQKPGLAAELESAFAKARTEREAKEAAQLAADSVPTDNVVVLRERATRHATEAIDGYWGHFDDMQKELAERVISPLLNVVSRVTDERDAARKELEPYEVLNPQQCPKGLHADWLVDSEYAHVCPWCRIAELTGEGHLTVADVVAWLTKKAHEYGNSNRENRAKAEAVGRMADKVSRGAIRPTEGGVS